MVLEAALADYIDARTKPRVVGNLLAEDLFPIPNETIFTYKKASDEFVNLLRSKVLNRQKKDECINADLPPCDLDMYNEYRRQVNNTDIDKSLPRGESLDISLRVDQVNSKTWKQPVLSEIYSSSKSTSYCVEFGELEANFKVAENKFSKRVQLQRDLHLNTPLLPFSVETVKIPEKEYSKMIKASKDGKKSIEIAASILDDSLIEVPVSFSIADGNSQKIEFRFPWTMKAKLERQSVWNEFGFKFTDIPDDILQYWKSLPILYTVDAQKQANCLLRFLADLYGIELDLTVMDLKALAVAAGCQMDEMNLLTLCIAVTGCVFPIGIDNFDQKWARRPADRPKEMSQYTFYKFHQLTYIYRVLMGLLIRNFFPDPDILLSATEMTQSSFVSWFCDFVGIALSGADVSDTTFEFYSREEMILALNPESTHVQYLSQLVIEVPTAQAGGARFLHYVRKCFFNQYSIIKKIRLPFSKEDKPNQSKNLDTKESVLMYERELSLSDQRNGAPVKKSGLQPNPQFKDSIYDLNIDTDDISKFFIQNDRRLVPSLEEWGRLNHDQIPILFSHLRALQSNVLTEFWIPRIRLYDRLRLIHLRISCMKESVELLDSVITMSRNNLQDHYEHVEEKRTNAYQNTSYSSQKDAKELVDQRQRVNLLSHEIHYTGTADRVGVDENIHISIPGNNTERNRNINAKRKARRMKKLSTRSDVIPSRDFKRDKRLRTIQSHGIDVDAPPVRRPSSESRSVSFVSSPEYQNIDDIDNAVPGPSSPVAPVSILKRPSERDSSRSRQSSGYSSSNESSRARHSSDYIPSRDFVRSSDTSGYSGHRSGSSNFNDSGRKRFRSADDLRNQLERRGDLRDALERKWSAYSGGEDNQTTY